MVRLTAVLLVYVTVAAFAQRGPAPDPLVRENATIRVAPHTYVIADNNTPLVPNVGIVVGTRATLISDPGLGRRSGETVLREADTIRKNAELYVASMHFHVEHTTGIQGLPPTAKYVNSVIQDADFSEGGLARAKNFAGRSAVVTELLKDSAVRKADIPFDREHVLDLGEVRVRIDRGRPDAHARRHGLLRRRRQRPLRRRRRHEQLVRRGEPELQHEGVAGGFRSARSAGCEDPRPRAR
jgi:hypothetical protein